MSAPDELPAALERLVALGQSPDINIRPVLLRVVVDMFIRKPHHAPTDLQQFEAIVSHLLDDAELDARLIVADKLSRHPATPRSLLDRFVAEQGSIATKVYQNAELDEGSLSAAANWSSPEIARAVAARGRLSPATVAVLAERPEAEVVLELVRNKDVVLDRGSFQKLARRARDDGELARALAVHRPADPVDLAPLFLLVGQDQRAEIIEAARRAELGRRAWGRSEPSGATALDHMDRLIRSGERDGFETALCLAVGLDGSILIPLLHDESGEPLALALAAAGASPELAARVFILGDARIGRSVRKVRDLTHIVATVSAPAARRLIEAIAGGSQETKRRPTLHTPAAQGRRLEHGTAAETAPARRDLPPAFVPARRSG